MADKKFNITFDVDANIGPIKGALNNLQGTLKGLNVPQGLAKGLESTFSKLTTEITNFEAVASKGFNNMGDVTKAEKSFGQITDLVSKLRVQIGQVKGLDPKKFLPEENLKKVKDLNSAWVKLKSTIEKGGSNSTEINKQTQALEKQQAELTKLQTSYKALAAENQSMGQQRGSLAVSLKADREEAEKLVQRMKELEQVKGGKNTGEYKQLASDLKTLTSTIETNQKQYDKLGRAIADNKTAMAGYDTQIKTTQENINSINVNLDQLRAAAQQAPEGLNELRQKLAELKGIDLKEVPTDIEQIGQMINSINDDRIGEIKQSLEKLGVNFNSVGNAAHTAAEKVEEVGRAGRDISAKANEIEQLANRVKYFFSIGNSVMLFRRAIKSAIDTVKELDSVMTQAAVVTKYTVGDMWSQLPQYAQRASELGVTIKGVYEASTLYYQQGLETNQVIGVANETLKMAKIAGLDYATATDYMTSALRGFNMEVNEASAQKVNDIYSQLAAHTASNVEEISTAMSKTAPLAHNAGMEIETTAALLAQMIERTREAPETLGTAMKTVIARFQELKKDPALIEPVDGEIVDANKVEAALRTIGVALRDSEGQFRDLDEVFLEISEKWDGLSTNTQRYIATIAAGSRQQSRFIAMMADYKRTTDLVALANNAAGASAEQFAKTQDSLESKINRLKTAWEQFTMGLANNQAIKTVVDLLTKFISKINDITTSLSGNSSALKTFFDFAFLVAGIKIARAALNSLFGWLVKTGAKAGQDSGRQLATNFGLQIKKLDKETRSEAKRLAKELTANLKNGMTFEDIAQKFESVPEEIRKNLLTAAPQIGQSFVNDFKEAISYDALDAEGKEDANAYIQAFNNALKNGDIRKGFAKLQEGAQYFNTTLEGPSRKSMNTMITSLNSLGSGISRTGSLFMNFGHVLSSLGLEKVGNAFSKIGTILVSLGGVISSLIPLITGGLAEIWAALAPILPILLAIGAAIGVIAYVFYKVNKNKLSNQIKEVEEQTKKAKEAADNAKKAYDQLLEDRSGYDDLQEKLKELTYGTKEWQEALLEVNNEVLRLIQIYPQLAKWIGRGSQGQLIIQDEGWDAAERIAQSGATRAAGALASSQVRGYNLKKQSLLTLGADDYQDVQTLLLNSKDESTQNAASYAYTIKQTVVSALDAFGKGTEEFNNEINNLTDTYNINVNTMAAIIAASEEYCSALEDVEDTTLSATKGFLTTGFSTKTSAKIGTKATDVITETFANKYLDQTFKYDATLPENERTFSAKDIHKNNFLVADADREAVKLLRERYQEEIDAVAAGYKFGEDEQHDLEVLLSAMTNQTIEQVQDIYTTKESLAQAIADAANSDVITGQMNDYAESFSNLSQDYQDALTQVLSKGTADIGNRKNLNTISKDLLQAWRDGKVTKELGDLLAKTFGDETAFENAINEAEKEADRIFGQNKINIVQSLLDNGVFGNSKDINKYLDQFNDEQTLLMSDIVSQTSGLSMDSQKYILENLPSAIAENQQAVQNLFTSLDFSNPINALLTLQNTTDEATKDIAQQLIKTESELFSAGNMFQYLVQSAEFDTIAEQLDDIAKNGKKITSSNIKELAKSSKTLNGLLNTGVIKASALAKAFNAYEQAGVPLDYFTTRVLNALSQTKTFDEALLELQEHYNNFDPGIDEGFAFDFLSNSLEKMQEFAGNYEYGNEAFLGYFKEIFGADKLGEILNKGGADARTAFDNALHDLEGWLSGDAYGFWSQAASGVWGDIGVAFGEEGEILIDTMGRTTEKLIADLAESTGLTENAITAFLTQYSAHSLDLKLELAENDYKAMESAFIENSGKLKVVSQQELEAFATATGKEVKEVQDRLAGKIKVVDWIDKDTGIGAVGDDLWQKIKEQLSSHNGEFDIKQLLNDTGVAIETQFNWDGSQIEGAKIDLDSLQQGFAQLGLSSEQISSITGQLSSALEDSWGNVEFKKTIEVPVKADDGSIEMIQTEVVGSTAEAVENGVNAALEAANYDLVAESIVNQDFTTLGNNVESVLKKAGDNARKAISEDINSLRFETKELVVNVRYRTLNSPPTGATLPGKAKGSPGLPHSEVALTGEEGYELAYDSHGAFVLGAQGPEVAQLEKGTVIYPHDVSKRILKGQSRKTFPNHVNGNVGAVWNTEQVAATNSFYGVSAAAATVNEIAETMEDINEETEEWENKYDWLYNLTQQINEELRTREKLERRYNRLLKTHAGSGAELKKITDEELASLQKRQALEEKMIQLRREELKEYLAANAALAKYATIDWDLEVVQIDWKAIDAVTDPETGEAIEKYIDRLEFIIDEIKNAEDAVEDIEDDIIELKERGKEQYKDLEDRVLDALISEQQELIDEQERINDSITEAASSLTDAISKNIQKMRQDRQNEETETSIAEKERRLAYLRQDTTGSNALEIKKLEQDLAKEKENYQDALIDQSLNDLKEQNDAAAEQREKQIELAQSQLDWQEKTGYYADEATRIVREGIGENGVMSENSELYRLLYAQEGVDGMSNASKQWWQEELGDTIHEAFVYLEGVLGGKGGSQAPENRDYMAEMISQSNLGRSANADMKELEKLENARNAKIEANGLEGTYGKTHMVQNYKEGKSSYNSSTDKDIDWMAQINKAIANNDWANAFFYAGKRDAKIEKDAVGTEYASDFSFDIVFDKWYAATKSKGKGFKTGGLADYTGPAWLDGTKSKPEMVLNAKDTENFIQLKDILAGLRSNLVGANSSGGDWYFDIDINVDEIANDYDVDKVAERIKQSIYNEATYRNVNAINFLK